MHFRERFPILESKTYLASHSLGAVPRETAASLDRYYREWAERGILAWDEGWWKILSTFGNRIADILHAPRGSVVPMENVTRGFAAVASSLDWSTKSGGKSRNKIVLTSLEFITSYPFWQGWAEMVGARIVQVESDDGIGVPTEKLLAAIDDETLLVATSHVYFRSGAIQDLRAVARHAHAKGAYVLGDGYQAAGIVPMNLRDLELDFYVGGSHKWLCGGPGAGFLYVCDGVANKLRPKYSGWFGIANPFEYDPATRFAPAEGAMRFMAGTPAVPALYAAIEGVSTVAELGLEKIRAHSITLTKSIVEEADARKFAVKTPRDPHARSGMVCIDFPQAKVATEALVRAGVIVDYRPNCGIRVSPHFYNGKDDLARFWSTLDGFLRSAK
ncbi:MAG: aminotransferase class V-fold PLP-dependent enzyme [Bdellovibrionales bacterium]|nr:aminotransferase class V-fold PLP-dependent enzyme [Bdellovibrionales bacterium]